MKRSSHARLQPSAGSADSESCSRQDLQSYKPPTPQGPDKLKRREDRIIKIDEDNDRDWRAVGGASSPRVVNRSVLSDVEALQNRLSQPDRLIFRLSITGKALLTKQDLISPYNEIWGAAGYAKFRYHGVVCGGHPPDVKAAERWTSDAFLRYWRSIAPLHVTDKQQRKGAE